MPDTQGPKGSSSNLLKIIILIGSFAVVIIIIVFTVIFLAQPSQPGQSANGSPTISPVTTNPLLATVGGYKIYKTTVHKEALEQYDPAAITGQVIRQYLDILVERKILEQEADRLGISVQESSDKDAYYTSLRNAIFTSFVQTANANVIGYSLPPPLEYEQTPEIEEQRALADEVGDKIVESLQAGQLAFNVTERIYRDYEVLEPVLSLNGYIWKNTPDKEFLKRPREYVFDKRDIGQQFYEALFSMQSGEITKYVWEDGSGLAVIQVISINTGIPATYDEWFEGKKRELVQYNYDELGKL